MAQTANNDNSGVGVVLGIVLAVVIAIGAYFFFKNEGALPGTETTNISVEAPDVAPSAGDNTVDDVPTTPSAPNPAQ